MTGHQDRRPARSFAATSAALALALFTGACATYTGGAYGGPDAPLRARLASTFELSARQPSLHFAVSDRAHVGLFQIYADGGVRALYPYRPEAPSRFGPGPHSVFSPTESFGNPWGSRFSSRFRPGYDVGHARMTYLVIVASREPLRMDRIRNDVPFRYRSVPALASPLQRGSAFGTMDLLLDRLIPPGLSDDDWDVDWTYTAIRAPYRRFNRVPFRRLAGRSPSESSADDSATTGDERKRLDPEGIPFNPPRVPADLPDVDVSGANGIAERTESRSLRPTPGPSRHFRRLFGDDRDGAESWSRPRSRDDEGRLGRRERRWSRQMDRWARNPEERSFPEPPRPPTRWNGRAPPVDRFRTFGRWPGDRNVGDADHSTDRLPARIDRPPRRSVDVEVRRPRPDRDRGEGGRSSRGGGSTKRAGGNP